MPVVFWSEIRRADLRANPAALFIFGDNEARCGLGGQAAEARGEPNACGVAVKRAPRRDDKALWSDEDFERCARVIDRDLEVAFAHVRAGGWLVVPRRGVGTGRARLDERAPRLMEHVRQRFRELLAEGRAAPAAGPAPRPQPVSGARPINSHKSGAHH